MEVVEGEEVGVDVVTDAGGIGEVVVDSVTAADDVVEIAFKIDVSEVTPVVEATLTDEATPDGSSTGA